MGCPSHPFGHRESFHTASLNVTKDHDTLSTPTYPSLSLLLRDTEENDETPMFMDGGTGRRGRIRSSYKSLPRDFFP